MREPKEYDCLEGAKTPSELYKAEYLGLAMAIVYQCVIDIVKETRNRLDREAGGEPKFSQDYGTAVRFLTRNENPLYLLEIQGEELIEKVIRRAEDDWKRKHKRKFHC